MMLNCRRRGEPISALAILLCSCGSTSDPGIRVALVSAPTALVAGQELTRSGSMIRVDALHWTTAEIELIGCPSAWHRAAKFLISEAHAHGRSSSTLMATPTVESAQALLDVQLAELAPPAGRYCYVRYGVAPADADAVGLDSAPTMLGSSFGLSGGYGERAAELEDFATVSTRSVDVTLSIDLDLSSQHRTATLRFTHDPERWFQGVDLSSTVGAKGEQAVLESFLSGLSVSFE